MKQKRKLTIIIAAPLFCILAILFLLIYFCRRRAVKDVKRDVENSFDCKERDQVDGEDFFIKFQGGEDLNVSDILEAPGEVIGKSSYGTLYRATLERTNSIKLLRFLRPACTGSVKEVMPVVPVLGSVRHPNLVPVYAFYAGPREEKLMVHPYYHSGTLAQFLRDEKADSYKWNIIYRISLGIVRGLYYLHRGLEKPIIHGNLKSKNVLLDSNYQAYLSDYSLHLLLNQTAGQDMLEALAVQGYKSPELIKMKDASEETDIYCLGIILLELITGKEPINNNPTPDQDFYLPDSIQQTMLDNRITDLYHPGILVGQTNDASSITEEHILQFFKLAMACCSPTRSFRPNIKQILTKLEAIEK